MRTREEQISHLSCAIFNERPGDIDECIALARKYILEAERRAEQRVRAEIGRDSERLDWLEKQIIRVRADAPYQPIILNGKYDSGELRDDIDAAREVG